MKICKTDFSRKWIEFELDGKEYLIDFYDNFAHGVNQVKLYVEKGDEADIKVKSTYPPLTSVVKEFLLLLKWEVLYTWKNWLTKRRQ
ncbi:MAG: hypothetical protein MR324_12155 [Lachnospiraceae bacterium]|nr:hypothetical protein [Lachnospiraceae bacterium]